MRDLLEYGHVRRPLLGISISGITPEDAQVYELPRIAGVLVEDFADDSPAERSGLQRHDVIVAIGGVAVERLGQFQRLIAAHDPGEIVEVDVVRYGTALRVPVRLTEADLGNRRVVRTAPERSAEKGLGVELADLTPTLARERRYRRAGGALILAVEAGSAAARKSVPAGYLLREINRTPVRSAREGDRLLGSLSSGSVASLLLEDPMGGTLIRNVRVP
jgi:serine protease Do